MEHKLLFIHHLKVIAGVQSEWVLKKEFILPFAPYPGLIIKEPGVSKSNEGKPWILAHAWKVGTHTVGSECYYNTLAKAFICESVQNTKGEAPNTVDSFLKIYLSQGWELIQEPEKQPDMVQPS